MFTFTKCWGSEWVSEWVSSCLTAHQHNTGYSVPLTVECIGDIRSSVSSTSRLGGTSPPVPLSLHLRTEDSDSDTKRMKIAVVCLSDCLSVSRITGKSRWLISTIFCRGVRCVNNKNWVEFRGDPDYVTSGLGLQLIWRFCALRVLLL